MGKRFDILLGAHSFSRVSVNVQEFKCYPRSSPAEISKRISGLESLSLIRVEYIHP